MTDKYKKLLEDINEDQVFNTYGYAKDLRQALSTCVAVIDVLEGALARAKFDFEMAIESRTGINMCAPRLIDEALDEARKLLEGEK
jgi:hypothetical protein